MGEIKGYEVSDSKHSDLKAVDDSLYAVFQLEELPFTFESAIFHQIADSARFSKNSTWYFVDFFSVSSYCEKWKIITDESSVSHKRIFRISADQFYSLLTKEENSFDQLLQKLPDAIEHYLESISLVV